MRVTTPETIVGRPNEGAVGLFAAVAIGTTEPPKPMPEFEQPANDNGLYVQKRNIHLVSSVTH